MIICVNCNGVRFNFLRYSVRHDSYGFERKFKVYAAEKYDENHQVIPDSLTPKGHVKKIYINPEWEYFKNKAKDKLSSSEGKALYYQRKFDVEPVFGTLKASLRFTTIYRKRITEGKSANGIGYYGMEYEKIDQ